MSFSTQDRPTNPAKFFMKVKSGAVSYYDKEKSGNVQVPVPLEFIVLDQLATVKGWSDADNSGFWSNEVKSAGTDKLTIRTGSGVKATGIWKEVKNDPAVSGAKFNASVYIAHKSGEGLVISNIAFERSALNAWIEFIQANKGVMKAKNKVVLTRFADAKKGAVSYKVPTFEAVELTPEEVEICNDLDKDLQGYLAQYFNYKQTEPVTPVDDVVIEDLGDPINLDDIPF